MDARGEHAELEQEALDVWLDFLRESPGLGAAEFEALCARHPGRRDALLALRARMDGAAPPTLPTEPGAGDVDPLVRLARLAQPIERGARYLREAELGRGGMGIVYRVRDTELNRTLALKEMGERAPALRPLSAARFMEEAQVTAQLDHPGIVPIYELGVDKDGRLFFAMKLVHGRDLKEIFELVREQREGWTQTRALGVLLRVCEAMAYAHSRGVIHRDLKPGNVMVGHFGEVYVMDWGLARALGRADVHDIRLKAGIDSESVRTERREEREEAPDSPFVTVDGSVVGTPAYMAPEQARGEMDQLSPRSDVYSIGAILYHLLTGAMPYQPKSGRLSRHTVLARVVDGPPPPVLRLAPHAPSELVAICDKAMAREAADRYPDTLALGEDLRAYLEHRVVRAHQTGAFAELSKWTQRNKGFAAALVAVLLVLAVGSGVAWLLKEESDRNFVLARDQKQIAERQSDELLRLSAFQRLDDLATEADVLWPPTPELIGAYDDWLARAGALLAELEPSPDGRYLGHRAKLAELEALARPPTPQERELDQRMDPRREQLAAKRARLAELARARSLRAPERAVEEPTLDVDPTLAAGELSERAWALVDPDRAGSGDEARGLALARRALESAEDDRAAVRAAEVLAWAFFANGKDEEALEEMETALFLAPPDLRQQIESSESRLRSEVDGLRESLAGLPALEREVATLEAAAPVRMHFANEEAQWWHSQLVKLVGRLEALADPATGLIRGLAPDQGWGIERRRAIAARIVEDSIGGAEARERWSRAIDAIADRSVSPAYGGLVIEPQLGLLPLGQDPRSGLWEFAELLSGAEARRGADGELAIEEETGIVLVLMPGGPAWLGAQAADSAQPNYDARAGALDVPLAKVRLSPFFFSKFEMTQAQWLRIAGNNPSEDNPAHYQRHFSRSGRGNVLVHPVEMVSWHDARRVLARIGLGLPTEAQWEYAARGGTTTAWWTGSEPAGLNGAANVLDVYAHASGGEVWGTPTLEVDDGYTTHAPVGSFAPNPFGLFDVHGNVQEWCLDGLCAPAQQRRGGLDPVCDPGTSGKRACRGGSYLYEANVARVTFRIDVAAEFMTGAIGVRPARSLR